MRPGSGYGGGARPGTGMQMPGSSAGRPGSRMRTGMVPGTPGSQAAYGHALSSSIQVTDRPVTTQGMKGMLSQPQGPGRLTQDRSYYLGVVRSKVGELQDEIGKFKEEIDTYNRDHSQYAQLEGRYESLIKEVRAMEGQLADYNLAMDKHRTRADPGEIEAARERLARRNGEESARLDQIFMQRQDTERKTQQLEEQMGRMRAEAEAKVNEMAPDKLERYRELQAESMRAAQAVKEKQEAVEQLAARVDRVERELAADTLRDEYERLSRRVTRLRKDRGRLEEEVDALSLDPREAQKRLIAKVKADQATLAELEERLSGVDEENERLRKQLAAVNTDVEERRAGEENPDKFDKLQQRDQEMTAFIDAFPQQKQDALDEQRTTQSTIVAILEHISEGVQRENAMPSQERVAEMKDELSFKQRQLASSQTTRSRLEQELQKRINDLDKINTLDEKISVELTSLKERIATMESEMDTFRDIDGLRDSADNTKTRLVQYKNGYIRRRDTVKEQVRLLAARYEQKKTALAENETASSLDMLEQKLRHYEQSIFSLREYIETKGRETDYVSVKEDCGRILQEVNAQLIEVQSESLL